VIRSPRAHLVTTAASHAGLSGKNNEDRYGVSAFQLGGDLQIPSVLGVVADGIGGHRAGEVAAELAIEEISRAVAQSDAAQPVQILQQAIITAGKVIATTAQSDPSLRGMGTTCACAWVLGDRLYTAYVGDSRIYLIRGGQIVRLTTDHTWIQEAIDKGILEQEQSLHHPNAHVIRRYVGSKTDVVPDTRLRTNPAESDQAAEQNQGMRLFSGDILLLCTDGLTDLVSDEEILGVIKKSGAEAGVQALINLANQRGGHDNTTVVVLRVPSAQESTVERAPISLAKRVGLACLAIVLVFGVVTFGGALWYLTRSEPVQAGPTPAPVERQATLFPDTTVSGAGGMPGLFPSSTVVLPAIETPGETPGFQSTQIPTLPAGLPATLTPWFTNTPQK
jgi:serine/threonine protein phosphatase PrpC